jgi:hypothetical protein
MTSRVLIVLLLSIVGCMVVPATAAAQGPSPATADEKPQRPTGLPSRLEWTFNFDAGWGTFGFANSLFDNPKVPGVEENLSDQWFEGFVKPALSGTYRFAATSELYGKVSAVGERTYGSVPAQFGDDVSSFGPEDLYIGWRSGKSLENLGENALDFVVGRSTYQLGHGFLLWDGASEGGSRGGYWTNARKAFEFAAIGRFAPGAHKVESFYLDHDDLPEQDTGSRLWGANYEYAVNEETTIGATYMKWFARPRLLPRRDGLNVFNLRAYTAPVTSVPGLSFEFEYASERNGDALDSNAWTLRTAYDLIGAAWQPTLSYRYAYFQGDDPETASNEAFDPLFLGFYDWGTWWQGEIAGEYFLANSNLTSHQVRLHVTPSEALEGGVIFYKFGFDQPQSVGPDVTESDAGVEIDVYADWKLNDNFTVSLLGAFADPGTAVQQATGRTKNLTYGMINVGYSF